MILIKVESWSETVLQTILDVKYLRVGNPERQAEDFSSFFFHGPKSYGSLVTCSIDVF